MSKKKSHKFMIVYSMDNVEVIYKFYYTLAEARSDLRKAKRLIEREESLRAVKVGKKPRDIEFIISKTSYYKSLKADAE